MNRDRRSRRGQSQELDRMLDRLIGQSSTADGEDRLDPALAQVAHRLVALSTQGAPDPTDQFITHLERTLMSQTADVSPSALTGALAPRIPTPRSPRSPSRPAGPGHQRDRRSWPAWLEIGAIAAVVLLILGAIIEPDALRNPFDRANTAAPPMTTGEPAGMYRGSAARTGVMSSAGPEGEPGIRWQIHDERLFRGVTASVVAGSTLYLISFDDPGLLTAINTANGSQRWQATIGLVGGVSPVVANGLVYVAADGYPEPGGYLMALDAATGLERWRSKTGYVQSSSPVVADGLVYVIAEDETLRAVDGQTGKEQWRFALDTSDLATPQPGTTGQWAVGGPTVASPAVSDGIVYATSNDGVLFALDAASGEQRWRFVSDANYLQTPAIADGTLYLVAQLNTRDPELRTTPSWLYALNATTGEQRWVRHEGQSALPPTVAGDLIYLSDWSDDLNPVIVALDVNKGEEQWRSPDGGDGATAVIAGSTLYTTSQDGGLYAIDSVTGETQWRVDLGVPQASELAVADGAIFLAANGTLFAFGGSKTALGTPATTPIANGDASGLPPCTVTPRELAEMTQEGTPTADLVPERPDWKDSTRNPILLSEIPDGPQADQAVVDGILQTLHDIAACDRPGYGRALSALFTDDFLRRGPGTTLRVTTYTNGQTKQFLGAVDQDGNLTTALADVRVLPDGRVGVLRFYGNPGNGEFTVFAEVDGRWLVDETRQVSPTRDMQG